MEDPKWTPEHETVLADWADKSVCYKWLHLKSNEKYHLLHILYTIPVIIMSTLTGTANFAQDQIPESFRPYAVMIIGFINILAGILTTIQQFLKINELNESHRVASISWDKFYRRLKVELSKNPLERQPVREFFNNATEEYDRLMEASPMIDDDILKLFKSTFDGAFTKETIKLEFKDISKPEICDSIESVKKSIYKKSDAEKTELVFKHMVSDIVSAQETKTKQKLIKDFYDTFQSELSRPPTIQEMIDNLSQDTITEEMLNDFLRSQQIETI
jgi:uncharacterized protein (UPF0297 family)